MSKTHEYAGEQSIQNALEEVCRSLIRSGLLTVVVGNIDNGVDDRVIYNE